MAKFVLLNCTSYVHGYDFTTDTNKAQLELEAAVKPANRFGGSGWGEVLGGLKDTTFDLGGLWESGTPGAQGSVDSEAFAALGDSNRLHTLAVAGVETSIAYAFNAGRFAYNLGDEVGEVAPFELQSRGTDQWGVVRGQLAKAKGTVSATGVLGSVLNLGAPTSTQRVYAGLHVFSAGTTLTVQVQSDDSAGMASPTTRGTIGPVTAAGGTWLTPVSGPFVGETHWRLNVSAVTGSFSVAGFIAVQ